MAYMEAVAITRISSTIYSAGRDFDARRSASLQELGALWVSASVHRRDSLRSSFNRLRQVRDVWQAGTREPLGAGCSVMDVLGHAQRVDRFVDG